MAEQLRIDDSMRMEIRFDSKYAAAAEQGTQRRSSNTGPVHNLRRHWHWVNGSVVGGVGMTHVGSHNGEPWNEMADSLAEGMAAVCQAPGLSWRAGR